MKKRGFNKAWLTAPALGLSTLGTAGCTTADLELLGTVASLAADIHYLTSDDVCPRGQSKYYDAYSDGVRCGYQLDSGKRDYGHGRGGHGRRGEGRGGGGHHHDAPSTD